MTDQIERVASALEWMEAHLVEPLTHEQVARRAGMSRYHFHRVFRALTGETIGAYLRRRRMSHAAFELVGTRRPIVEIAFDAQFESQEAFTRAFRAQFETTPARMRATGHVGTRVALRLTLADLEHRQEGVTMEPQYKDVGALTLIGLGLQVEDDGPKPNPEISALWSRFFERIDAIRGKKGTAHYGGCLPQHSDLPRGNGEGFVYLASTAVEPGTPAPEGMMRVELAPAHYAVFTHRGPLQRMGKTISYIWGTWLPAQGIKPTGPDFGYYDERFRPDTHPGSENSELDFYIPV